MNIFLVSIFGLLVVNRFFIRLRCTNFISQEKSKVFFWISLIPLVAVQFFKDPVVFLIIYIGIFLLSLILFFIIFEKIMKKIFEKSKIQLLDSIVLQIRVGCSPQKALAESLYSSSKLEKKVFEPLKYIFLPNFSEQQIQIKSTKHYILELRSVLLSSSRTLEQLQSLRDGLKIQHQFKHKTAQVTQQIKAQAIVAAMIYIVLLAISYYNLSLGEFPKLIVFSLSSFVFGLILIFKIGDKIKWKI